MERCSYVLLLRVISHLQKEGKWPLSRYGGLSKTRHRCIALTNKSFCSFKYPYLKRDTTLVGQKSPHVVQMLKIEVKSHLRNTGNAEQSDSRSNCLNFSFL